MSTLTQILLFTFFGSIVSLIGGILLLFKKNFAGKLADYLSAFAAGTLLGTAFFDLLPEALEGGTDTKSVMTWTLVGILIFFLLQRSIHWFHHPHGDHDDGHNHPVQKPTGPLIIIGDSLHNFIDGVAIAATFLVNPTLGMVTTLAVGAHEIPHEIGNFAVLLSLGYSRKKVLWYNVLSACTAFAGALLTYYVGPSIAGSLPIFLGITAGFFIYIAASDLIPEIHGWSKNKLAVIESFLLIAGAAIVGVLVHILE
jgi:zinc and cadmium transporter